MKKRILIILLSILVIAAVGFGAYRYILLSQEVARLKTSPTDAAKKEAESLVSQVRALIAVPSDEMPTIATVSDPEKLKANVFFANAVAGDKVLIYTQAKKAILYRPGEKKIIEVAPLSIGTSSAQLVSSEITFVLYNGTTVTGLTKKYETELKEKIPTAVIVDRDNAKKQEYEKSLLIDLSGTKSDQAKEMATALGLNVSELPDGETKSEGADFLIILGADKK